MKKIILLFLIICVSCLKKSDVYTDSSVLSKCVVKMNARVTSYEGNTKASESTLIWEDGTQLFLNFFNEGKAITGVAEYSSDQDLWTLTYNGNLVLAEDAKVSVYYFTNYEVSDTENEINLLPESAIYADTDAKYSYFSDGELKVTAHLIPIKGRLRFKGEKASQFNVSGVTTSSEFNLANQKFTYTDDEISTIINSDGFSPYIYGTLENTESKLIVNNQYCRFEKICGSNVLANGKSGYLNLPYQDNCFDWELIPVIPTVQTLTPGKVNYISPIATLNGQILSNGGAAINEYGFVFGTDIEKLRPVPVGMLDDDQFSCDMSVSGDSTYFYRAYAKNNQGVSYGELETFMPKSDCPKLSMEYVYNSSKKSITMNAVIEDLNNSALLDYGFEMVFVTKLWTGGYEGGGA